MQKKQVLLAGFLLTSADSKRWKRATLGLAMALLAGVTSNAAPVSRAAPVLLRQLASPAAVRWHDTPLRTALLRLGEATGAPIWIDRRVDPQQEVTLVTAEQPLATVLDRAVGQAGLGAVAIDRVVYVGPSATAKSLVRLREETDAAATKRMSRRGAMSWERLSTPRQIVARLADRVGVVIDNPETIPHDLWPAGATPAMSASDRLTLLLSGFDLRWRPVGDDGRRVRIEPIEAGTARGELSPLAALLRSKQDLQKRERRYTLRIVDKPLGAVLRQLAAQLNRELEISPELGEMNERISVDVEQATLDDLLDALGEAGGVSVVNDKAIVVRPLP